MKTTTSEHTVAVTTQEALDGCRENNEDCERREQCIEPGVKFTAGALDVTNCDFIVRSARDE